MTYQTDCTLPNEILEQIAEQGLDYLPELIRVAVNAAMKAERQQYLGAAPYERSEQRREQANGFKPKRCERAWAKSNLPCRRCGKASSTRRRWKRVCAASAP